MLNTQFLKKELKEAFKTSRALILISLFVFFAILGPVTAKYMNELITLLASGINLEFPEPTILDSWTQFFKNTTSLCLIVYLIIMTGSVANEKSKGSILLVLTKKTTRFNFLFSKFLGGVILFSVCYIISILISGLYTQILFQTWAYDGLGVSLLMTWLMGVFFTSLAMFTSIISKSGTTAALLGFAGYALFSLLNVIQDFPKFNPAGSSTIVNQILAGTLSQSDNLIQIGVTILCSAILFSISYVIFKKQEI